MGPKTGDRPTQVESSGGRARVFQTLQTPRSGDETWVAHYTPETWVNGEVEKWTKELAGNYFEEDIKQLIPGSPPALKGMVTMSKNSLHM